MRGGGVERRGEGRWLSLRSKHTVRKRWNGHHDDLVGLLFG